MSNNKKNALEILMKAKVIPRFQCIAKFIYSIDAKNVCRLYWMHYVRAHSATNRNGVCMRCIHAKTSD